MCGIGAVLNNTNARELLEKSLKKVRHRGSRKHETEHGKNYALGANRLPIVDRLNAVQPARNEDSGLFCVFNGEVYNHRGLKAALEEKGHRFRTDSDTEVLVHLYEEHGERMLDFLDSEMYAFVIYDKIKKGYFAARDPIGVKPLYWAQADGTYFASEMKQLVQFPDVEDILLVPPGHYVKDGKMLKYSDLIEKKDLETENWKHMTDVVRALLHDAVKKRVQTDLPKGVFLSGGVDSTAVLALARKHKKNITALIAGKKDSSDRRYAERYCKEFGIPYKTTEPPDEAQLVKEIERIVRITETFEPNVIRQSMISYYISKLGKDFRVILCGEGADEIFAGYPEFAQADDVNSLCIEFLRDLNRTQCQRVDRTSMHFTQEVRSPFLDSALVDYALRIPGRYKVRDGITKWILRKAMEHELPDYICWRRKVVLSEGAGYKGNDSDSGIFTEFIDRRMSEGEFQRIKGMFPEWKIQTKEEAYYFRIFRKLGFIKGRFAQKRVRANKTSSVNRDIFRILKSRKFNRHMPYRIDDINEHDLRFVMFWGALGKKRTDRHDLETIGFLKEFRGQIEKAGGRVEIKMLLADSHAKMNGIADPDVYTYLESIRELLEGNGFKAEYLSSLWKKWNLGSEATNGKTDAGIRDLKLLHALKRAAKRYYRGDPDEGYRVYYSMRIHEKPILETEFRGYVFLTFNRPCFREILPDLPTLHIRSNHKSSKPPWIP